ncbi:MAG TPA: DUF1569 domain-containing protein [Chitinophagaceae bacterium]|nr:DUF1569 domain-containing protein [Chitinophagaceae bacterium]HNU13911.1 DUF1569 domain-containing protein [Chitinophagaceae bacterium]
MEIKNLLDTAVKQEIINRLNKLSPQSQRQWGKMDVAQMLAHLQVPIGVALGTHTVKGNLLMKLILPLFKKKLYDEKPWKQGLPTDKTFIMTGKTKDFELERNKLMDMVNRFTEANMVNEKHPIFGRLTKEQWSKATWKHIDHHLKQFGA